MKAALGPRAAAAASARGDKKDAKAPRKSAGAKQSFQRSHTTVVTGSKPPGKVPPPPALSSVQDQRRSDATRRVKASDRDRSKSPQYGRVSTVSPSFHRSHSALSPNSKAPFARTASHWSNAVRRTNSILSTSTRQTDLLSPNSRQKRQHTRSPSPHQRSGSPGGGGLGKRTASSPNRKKEASKVEDAVHSPKTPSSPEARMKGVFSPLGTAASTAKDTVIGGFTKTLVDNFGIEPEDLKMDYGTVLGTGGFGTVYLGDYQATEVAVKVHNTDEAWTPSEIQEWKREVSIMTRLRHPNILMLLGAVFYKTKLAIVTELCERGTLLKYLQKSKEDNVSVTWAQKVEWMRQIAQGMAFLHHKRIFHRDLKAANVFVTGDMMKIADFGLSRVRTDQIRGLRADSMAREGDVSKTLFGSPAASGSSTPAPKTKERVRRSSTLRQQAEREVAQPATPQQENSRIQGTFAFIAPEIWSETPYTEKADVYSFGVLQSELLTCAMPFALDVREELSWRIMVGQTKVKVLHTIGGTPVPQALQDVQARCLAFRPEERPYFTEVVSMLKAVLACEGTSNVCPWPLNEESNYGGESEDLDPLSEEVEAELAQA
eukprot:Rhum_TRINITY_DN14387_c17_g1::Rhum_TRINITY_DN14387_c17_g1_i1::g.87073::m.87073